MGSSGSSSNPPHYAASEGLVVYTALVENRGLKDVSFLDSFSEGVRYFKVSPGASARFFFVREPESSPKYKEYIAFVDKEAGPTIGSKEILGSFRLYYNGSSFFVSPLAAARISFPKSQEEMSLQGEGYSNGFKSSAAYTVEYISAPPTQKKDRSGWTVLAYILLILLLLILLLVLIFPEYSRKCAYRQG